MKALRVATVAALALLLCWSGSVSAQFPPGLFDGVAAVAAQPGAIASYASSQSGATPVTWTSGPASGGSAMAQASSSGSGGTMTSTTINGVTQTTVNGSPVGAVIKPAPGLVVAGAVAGATTGSSSGGCTSISSTNTQACDGPSGRCCAVTSDVKRCGGYAHARGSINGQAGMCCITLFSAKDRSPALWCAGPPSKAYYALPASARVDLRPSCATSYKDSKAGSLSCIVSIKTMPKGFLAPRGYTTAKPLIYNKGTGFSPCMSPAFSRVLQVDTLTKDGVTRFTSKCE